MTPVQTIDKYKWLGSDPMKDGLNWYQYVRANPATWVDPFGLTFIIAWSYGSRDIKGIGEDQGFNEHLGYEKINSTEHWTDDDWAQFEKRSAYSRAAQRAKQDLLNIGIPEEDIILVRIDSKEELKRYWSEWTRLEVVEQLLFLSHGTSDEPDVYGGSDYFFLDAAQLNWGAIERWIYIRDIGSMKVSLQPFARFTGCNTGAGDFAQSFANSQNVTTYAPRYASSFSRSPTVRIPIDTFGTHKDVYNVTFTQGRSIYKNGMTAFYEPFGARFDPE